MAIISDGKGVAQEPEAAALQMARNTPASFTDLDTYHNPTAFVERAATEAGYAEHSWFRDFLAGQATGYGGAPVTSEDLHTPSPMMEREDYQRAYAPTDPATGKELSIGDGPMPQKLAQEIGKQMSDRITSDSNLRRFEAAHSWPTNFAANMAVGMVDPINLASMILPGVGEEMIASRLGLTAAGLAGRTLARGISGATFGAAQAVPIEALKYGLSRDDDTEANIRTGLYNAFVNAPASMATMMIGLGGAGDLFKHLAGTAAERATIPAESRPVLNEITPVAAAPIEVADAARRASVTQLMTGKPVDVDAFFPQPPLAQTATAVGRFMDNPYLSEHIPTAADLGLDRDEVARQIAPELFKNYDDMATRHANLDQHLQELTTQRAQGIAEESRQTDALNTELADLQRSLPGSGKQKRVQIANRIAEIGEEQKTPPSVTKPSENDLAMVQKAMMSSDFKMRDMATDVSAAYARADETITRATAGHVGGLLEDAAERQRAFVRPVDFMKNSRADYSGMVDREKGWRDTGVAPGIAYSDLVSAIHEVDTTAANAKPEPPVTKPPAEWAIEPKVEAAETPKGEPATTAAEPTTSTQAAPREALGTAAPAPAEALPKTLEETFPGVDMTTMTAEERAILETARGVGDHADRMAQAYEEAAKCLKAAGG